MAGYLWRTLFAVLAVVLVIALIPPVSHIIGLAPSADVLLVIHVCIAGLAVLYIFTGDSWKFRG